MFVVAMKGFRWRLDLLYTGSALKNQAPCATILKLIFLVATLHSLEPPICHWGAVSAICR